LTENNKLIEILPLQLCRDHITSLKQNYLLNLFIKVAQRDKRIWPDTTTHSQAVGKIDGGAKCVPIRKEKEIIKRAQVGRDD